MNEKLEKNNVNIAEIKELNEIPNQLSKLNNSLDGLEKSIEELHRRLSTVMSCSTPKIEDESGFPELESILGTEIFRLYIVSENLKESITDILCRLKI